VQASPLRSTASPGFRTVRALQYVFGVATLGLWPKAPLKSAVRRFESIERVQELEACLLHLPRMVRKLVCCLDHKSNPVNNDADLVSHFELYR